MPKGGARPGSGPTVNRLRLDRETAQMLRIMTLARRAATGRQVTALEVATWIIRREYEEYEAGLVPAEGEEE